MKLGEHIFIAGRTGNGKSVKALDVLSQLIKSSPDAGVLIINHKNDDYSSTLKPVKTIPSKIKRGQRLHITPLFGRDDDAVDNLLYQVYKLGNFIVWVDEGYMFNPNNQYIAALLTQGRAKNISVIFLSQRPKRVTLFAVTQASYIFLYGITGQNDMKTISEVMNTDGLYNLIESLEKHHYISWNADDRNVMTEHPVPYPVEINLNHPRNYEPFVIAGLILITLLS